MEKFPACVFAKRRRGRKRMNRVGVERVFFSYIILPAGFLKLSTRCHYACLSVLVDVAV